MGMMTSLAPSTVPALTDEIDRYVLQLDSPQSHWVAPYIAIACDRAGASRKLSLLCREDTDVFMYAGELFGCLCHGRAQACVDTKLRMGGKIVKPETYLRSWRAAITGAHRWPHLSQLGVELWMTLRGDPASISARARRWRADLGVEPTIRAVFGDDCLRTGIQVEVERVVIDAGTAAQASLLQWALRDGGGDYTSRLSFSLRALRCGGLHAASPAAASEVPT